MLPQLIPSTHGVTLLLGFHKQEPLLDLIVRLALAGPMQVVVGGNRFDAHRLARLVRWRTVLLDQTLERIGQRRPFTANQTVQLIEELEPATPIVLLDLLTAFYDENVTESESVRLVRLVTERLRLLGAETAVVVTVRQPPANGRGGLVTLVRGVARRVYQVEPPREAVQGRLF